MGEKFTEQNVFSISDATIAVVSANTSSTYTQGKKIRVPLPKYQKTQPMEQAKKLTVLQF